MCQLPSADAKAMYARYQAAQSKADEAAVQAASLAPPAARTGADSLLPLPSLAGLPLSAGGPEAVRRRRASRTETPFLQHK